MAHGLLQGLSAVGLILALTSAPLSAGAGASPSAQIPPTTISVTVDRGPQSTYFVGDPITICVTADTRVGPGVADYAPFVRLTDVLPNGTSSVIFEGQVAGQRCTSGVITLPTGTETIRAEYLVVGITGQPQVVNTAQVSFQVAARTQTLTVLPAAISVTVDRGPQSIYFVGDPITICVMADTPAYYDGYTRFVRLTDILPNGSSSVIYEGSVNGQRCTTGVITPPVGVETIRADYVIRALWDGSSSILNTAQVTFQIIDRAPFPLPPPPPTATLPPTPSPLPPPTATPLPTVAPFPELVPPTPTPTVSAPGSFSLVLLVTCDESGSATVQLGWSESVGADVYGIYRDGDFVWAEGARGAQGFIDSPVPNAAVVLYQVIARNAVGAQAAEPDPLVVETPDCLVPMETSEEITELG